ncbi:MAG: FAD/NAD(P)-binding protein [Thermodesulfobacteriota bacterium]
MKNIYMPEVCALVDLKEETPNITTLTVTLGGGREFDCRPGQFVEFTVFGQGEFPVSVADVVDPARGVFKVTVQRIGKVTREVARLSVGSKIGIRGPFGHGFPLEQMAGKDVCLISGGVGLAGSWLLLQRLLQDKARYGRLNLLYGARTPEDMIYKDALFPKTGRGEAAGFETLLTVDSADNGWRGRLGLVTELLTESRLDPENTVAAVCGPGVMIKAAARRLMDLGLADERVFVSLERRMQCGMGICGHCMVGWKRVCLDGPVFSLAEIKGALEGEL